MRQVINKLIREEDLYERGRRRLLAGLAADEALLPRSVLPTEMDEDTLGIAELARNCVEVGRRHNKSASVTASVGGFVPKPLTPFQWFGQNTVDDLRRKVEPPARRPAPQQGRPAASWHDPAATLVEGIASRGDRRLGPVIEDVWRAGGVFQEWSEHFDLVALGRRHGPPRPLDRLVRPPAPHRRRGAALGPHLGRAPPRLPLAGLAGRAAASRCSPDCRWTPCYDCGVCTGYGIEHLVASPTPPAGGSQGTGQDLSRAHEVPVTLTRQPATSLAGARP